MNLVVLGPQGSGKGTQAKRLARDFSLEHVDMGRFLREVAAMDTPLGREVYLIQNVTKTLVPSRILREVFTVKLSAMGREQGIVFDGFPRNLDQAEYFSEALRDFGRKIDRVIFIKIGEEESMKRIAKRWICRDCREVIIKQSKNESSCSKCGGELEQRADDTEEGVQKRLHVFREETLPVVEKYCQEGLLLEIDGEQSIDAVYQEIISKLND